MERVLVSKKAGKHLVARGSRGQAFKFGQEVIGERLSRVRSPDLQLQVQRVRHIPDLDHLGHVINMRACWPHVKAQLSVTAAWAISADRGKRRSLPGGRLVICRKSLRCARYDQFACAGDSTRSAQIR
jgi:hypothetical protein